MAKGRPRTAKAPSDSTDAENPLIFLSYGFPNEDFVERVDHLLCHQLGVTVFFYKRCKHADQEWADAVEDPLSACAVFVLFLGADLGNTQHSEALKANSRIATKKCRPVLVQLPNGIKPVELKTDLTEFHGCDPVRVSSLDETEAARCAKVVMGLLGLAYRPIWSIPADYPFEYEKDVISEFIAGHGALSAERVAEGCPMHWPSVLRCKGNRLNPASPQIIGGYRDRTSEGGERDPQVVAMALTGPIHSQSAGAQPDVLTFPEAGPRYDHTYPLLRNNNINVGILVSGGIAPGINAVISGIVQRHKLYAEELKKVEGNSSLQIICYREGLQSLVQRGHNRGPDFEVVTLNDIEKLEKLSRQAQLGGSLLPTSRAPKLLDTQHRTEALENIVNTLHSDQVQILYVIGGDGSMKAAHAIQREARKRKFELSVVGVPKAMDNDILWVWQSFGFLSAVEIAKETVRHLHTEAMSNPRVCLIQLFGSDSGFVVCHAALASGVCDLVLIPEVDFEIRVVVDYVKDKLSRRLRPGFNGQSPYGIVLMAETAIPKDILDWLDSDQYDFELTSKEADEVKRFVTSQHRRIYGQTPDKLRQAALKIVKAMIQRAIDEMKDNDAYWKDFRVFDNQPRHLIRAIPPSASDIIYGQRLGILAVDCAMAGYQDFMISQWLTEYVMVPLELVVLGRKRVPRDGIFWKSVLASTGQPARLVTS